MQRKKTWKTIIWAKIYRKLLALLMNGRPMSSQKKITKQVQSGKHLVAMQLLTQWNKRQKSTHVIRRHQDGPTAFKEAPMHRRRDETKVEMLRHPGEREVQIYRRQDANAALMHHHHGGNNRNGMLHLRDDDGVEMLRHPDGKEVRICRHRGVNAVPMLRHHGGNNRIVTLHHPDNDAAEMHLHPDGKEAQIYHHQDANAAHPMPHRHDEIETEVQTLHQSE